MNIYTNELQEIFCTKEFEEANRELIEIDKQQNSVIIDACFRYNPHALTKYAAAIKKKYPELSKTIKEITQRLISVSESMQNFEDGVLLIKKSAMEGYKKAVAADEFLSSLSSTSRRPSNIKNEREVEDSKENNKFIRSPEIESGHSSVRYKKDEYEDAEFIFKKNVSF